MLNSKQKRFFADTARGSSVLSNCTIGRGAVLTKGEYILAYGYNRKLVRSKNYEISAIYDAIFRARDMDLFESTLFSTYFPPLDDMKLIIACRVSTVYFFGEIDDPHSVELSNRTAQEKISLELIQLK